jgi:FdhD protein
MIINSQMLYRPRRLHVYDNGSLQEKSDPVVIETHLHLSVNDEPWAELVCSPQAYGELAVGYLLSENVLQDYCDLRAMEVDEQQASVRLYTDKPLPGRHQNFRQVNSCMGKGQQGLQTDTAGIIPVQPQNVFSRPEQIFAMVAEMESRGSTFRLTGGTHSAALGDQGKLLASFEDIGRHNAVDKVFGHAFLKQIPLHDKCIVLSGRIASEILLKAARRHVAMVISRSAATGLAVDLAEELGITLVGFTRGDKFNIYCHPQRVKM